MSESQSGKPEIRRKDADHRYEAWLEGGPVGFVSYREEPGRVVLLHTEVAAEVEGQGVGGALVRGVLDDLRARGEEVGPACPFVAAYIKRHPDYQTMVPREYDQAIGRDR